MKQTKLQKTTVGTAIIHHGTSYFLSNQFTVHEESPKVKTKADNNKYNFFIDYT